MGNKAPTLNEMTLAYLREFAENSENLCRIHSSSNPDNKQKTVNILSDVLLALLKDHFQMNLLAQKTKHFIQSRIQK